MTSCYISCFKRLIQYKSLFLKHAPLVFNVAFQQLKLLQSWISIASFSYVFFQKISFDNICILCKLYFLQACPENHHFHVGFAESFFSIRRQCGITQLIVEKRKSLFVASVTKNSGKKIISTNTLKQYTGRRHFRQGLLITSANNTFNK